MEIEHFEGHTAGPWRVGVPEYEDEGFAILMGTRLTGLPGEGAYRGVCKGAHAPITVGAGMAPCDDACEQCAECAEFAEVEANARLIAAAPDLLAEVKRLRKALRFVEANDRSREYEHHEKRTSDGALPSLINNGTRWLTPCEIARDALRREVSADAPH